MSKHYVVWVGKKPGVYDNWPECQQQVSGFKGALYKSFADKSSADLAFQQGQANTEQSVLDPMPVVTVTKASTGRPLPPYLSVDAAYSHSTKILEWRGVLVKEDGSTEQVFRSRPYNGGSANIGEFLAVLDGYSYLSTNNLAIPLYSDSITAQAWLRDAVINSTVKLTTELNSYLKVRLEALRNGSFKTIQAVCPIRDWKSSAWGEIPADFGRKKGPGIPRAVGPVY
jgi:ribonuclease HI